MEAWEYGVRAVVLQAGAKALEGFFKGFGCGKRDNPVICDCGTVMKSRGQRKKTIKTILGDVSIHRSYFVCPDCGKSCFPADELLDTVGTTFSPGLRRLMADAGAKDNFKEGSESLKLYGEITVTAKEVERVSESMGSEVDTWQKKSEQKALAAARNFNQKKSIPTMYVCYDGTGVPMVPWELKGRKGKQPDGSAKTREATLGCVFTQTTVDEKSFPIRDEESTTYIGEITPFSEFGVRIKGEAKRRGMDKAETVVVIADGARKNWTTAEDHFKDAVWIVDLFHAREHLYNLVKILADRNEKTETKLKLKWLTLLDEGRVEKLLEEANEKLPRSGKRRKQAQKEMNYFKNNKERMRYAEFRERGFFVGSGVIEAGCKTLVSKRLKQSAMKWTVEGANSIIALRCAHLSNTLEDFYETKTA